MGFHLLHTLGEAPLNMVNNIILDGSKGYSECDLSFAVLILPNDFITQNDTKVTLSWKGHWNELGTNNVLI
jgi:hypothetical protein